MRAYDMAMCLIFVNCAFPIIELFGLSLPTVSSKYGALTIFNALYMKLFTFTIGDMDININPLVIFAIALAAGTIVVASTHAVTDRGIAMITFTTVFWGSFGIASSTLMGMILYFGFSIFWGIFLLASTLIFINAMVQFPLGGEWGQI